MKAVAGATLRAIIMQFVIGRFPLVVPAARCVGLRDRALAPRGMPKVDLV